MDTVGRRVVFRKQGKEIRGTVEGDVSVLEPSADEDFLNLIQHIRWDDGVYTLRICHYVRPRGSSDKDWVFANRPLSTSVNHFEKLLKEAAKKGWFSL